MPRMITPNVFKVESCSEKRLSKHRLFNKVYAIGGDEIYSLSIKKTVLTVAYYLLKTNSKFSRTFCNVYFYSIWKTLHTFKSDSCP